MSHKLIPDHKLLDVLRELSDNDSSSGSKFESNLKCNFEEDKQFYLE